MDAVVEDFAHSLEETMAWVRMHATESDPKGCLRNRDFDGCVEPFVRDDVIWGSEDSCSVIMECVRRERLRSLEAAGWHRSMDNLIADDGRLLVYWPDCSVMHGLGAEDTGGFLYDDESPPWGSWVWCHPGSSAPDDDQYVLSWVPRMFIAVVTAAMDIEPIECYRWSSAADTPLLRAVRRAGILGGDRI